MTSNPIDELPQADDLNKVVVAVQAVEAGAVTDSEIATALTLVDRQGAYYRRAAEILQLIRRSAGGAVVTERGQRLLHARDAQHQLNLLRYALRGIPAVCSVLDAIIASTDGITEAEMDHILRRGWTEYSTTTRERRSQTIATWLQQSKLAEVKNGRLMRTIFTAGK